MAQAKAFPEALVEFGESRAWLITHLKPFHREACYWHHQPMGEAHKNQHYSELRQV